MTKKEYEQLKAYARVVCRTMDADDLIHDLIAKAIPKNPNNILGYLRRAVQHESFDRKHNVPKRVLKTVSYEAFEDNSIFQNYFESDDYEFEQRVTKVRRRIKKLPTTQQKVINYYVKHYPVQYDKAAAALGMSLGNFKRNLTIAKNKLRGAK